MAYQNVGTPRFYVNTLEWLSSVGVQSFDKIVHTLPVDMENVWTDTAISEIDQYFGNEKNFAALLGHTIDRGFTIGNTSASDTQVNYPGWSSDPPYNGFTLWTFTGIPANLVQFYGGGGYAPNIGSIVIGNYYDMPHSPDLKLTMEREMDGVKKIRTKGGADLVNHKYTKPPKWGGLGAWELSTSPTGYPPALSRSGRRVWNLSFSYLQDSDMFPMLSSLNPYESTSATEEVYSDNPETNWHIGETLLDDNTFYSQVIHKTNGGQLPFIFQPDNNNNNPDGFAICKFDMDSFEFSQVANGVYNIKLKIREVW